MIYYQDRRYVLNWQDLMMSLSDLVALFLTKIIMDITEHEDNFESGSRKFI